MDQAECWKIKQEIASYGEFITTYSAAQSTIRGHIGWILRTLAVLFPNRTL